MNRQKYIGIPSEKKNKKRMRYKMKRIQTKSHQVGTYNINKISLSC